MSPCRNCRDSVSCGDGTELCKTCQRIENIQQDFVLHKHWDRRIITELKQKLQKAEEVIRFYADSSHYSFKIEGNRLDILLPQPVVNEDRGQKAREYLEGEVVKEKGL